MSAAEGHVELPSIMMLRLLRALQHGIEPDMNVYDAVTWSVVSPLSERSVANRSAPIDFPISHGASGKYSTAAAPIGLRLPPMKDFLLLMTLLAPAIAAEHTTFYFVDVGHGNATFVVSPAGEVMLLDAGPIQAGDRIVDFMTQNGINKVDYMVVSHFEGDHMGAVPKIAAKYPIANFVDHGTNVTYAKEDNWWRERRGPWMKGNGWGKHSDWLFDNYVQVRNQGHYLPSKAGDRIPVKGLDAIVVVAAGKVISQPLVKNAPPPSACGNVERRADDDAEDGQSLGLVLQQEMFRFVYLGDLTWNPANSLFCPHNLVGPVDAYLVTHHGQSMNNDLTPYYYGLSCCPPPEIEGLHPRAAFLSMGAEGHKEANPGTIQRLLKTPGLDLWQTELITSGGEKGVNASESFIANIGRTSSQVPYIKMIANADGSFEVVNSRNQFSKKYAKRE
jgi:hypothetical protein